MSEAHAHDDKNAPRYRSSAAARMVNIPVATLRVWERRYQVVGPVQAPSGQRLYSSQDVRRLVLIKQLVNRGHAIGMLARQETPRLQDLLDEARVTDGVLQGDVAPLADPAAPDRAGLIRVLLVGTDAATRWSPTLEAVSDVQIVGHVDASAASELALRQIQAEVVLADLGSMHMETVDWLARLSHMVGARQMIVVYGFANSQVIDALRARAAIVRRSPLEADELLLALMDAVRGWRSVAQALRTVPDPAPARRFDAQALAALAQAMPRVACECPKHLADLVKMLGQFEAYSADCESRQPADVALHAYLYRVAGHARALMEDALITIAKAEGLDVDQATALSASSTSSPRNPPL